MGFGFIVGSDTSDGSDDEDSDEVVEVVESEQTGDATYNGPYVTKEGESVRRFSFPPPPPPASGGNPYT